MSGTQLAEATKGIFVEEKDGNLQSYSVTTFGFNRFPVFFFIPFVWLMLLEFGNTGGVLQTPRFYCN